MIDQNSARHGDLSIQRERRDVRHQELRWHGRRMLTVAEAAHHLGCSPWKVRDMIANGVLDAVRYSAKTIRIREHSVAVLVMQAPLSEAQ